MRGYQEPEDVGLLSKIYGDTGAALGVKASAGQR